MGGRGTFGIGKEVGPSTFGSSRPSMGPSSSCRVLVVGGNLAGAIPARKEARDACREKLEVIGFLSESLAGDSNTLWTSVVKSCSTSGAIYNNQPPQLDNPKTHDLPHPVPASPHPFRHPQHHPERDIYPVPRTTPHKVQHPLIRFQRRPHHSIE